MSTTNGTGAAADLAAPPAPADPAERSLLGALLAAPVGMRLVDGWLAPTHFARQAHGWIYAALQGLYRAAAPCDLTTVAEALAAAGHLAPIGGAAYLTQLLYQVPDASHVETYARSVEAAGTRRALALVAQQIGALAQQPGGELEDTLGQAEALLRSVTDRPAAGGFQAIKDLLTAHYDALGTRAQPGAPPGWPTGIERLNRLIRWRAEQYIVPAARPSEGKTALALGWALAAAAAGARVAIASLEMSNEDVLDRLVAMTAPVDLHALRSARLGDSEWAAVHLSFGSLGAAPIYLLDTPELTVPQLRGHALQLQARVGLDLLIVDYLQLIRPTRPSPNRTQEVDAISRECKGLARRLAVPLIVPSQLSRAIELRASHTPQLSDLREAGGIENDADVVIFIHRPDPTAPELAELHLAKHRNGPKGVVPVYWHGSTVRFHDRDTTHTA